MTTAAHPYSPAFESAGFGFVSGALSVDESGPAVPGRRAALEAAVARLAERLATIDMNLSDVVKTTYFVTDVTLRDEANEHYREVFVEPRPARSFVQWLRCHTAPPSRSRPSPAGPDHPHRAPAHAGLHHPTGRKQR
ncbi:RidA family protein [Nocardioides sp. B-3]|uniref:RidA family protein n=1 Tax=Nocardioides sp. B-3 TaxID=2895565 RepID=UPI0021523533|nr:RidA family protein [Nocardioides sp. B-3]UUZ60304.1 RidA family protein [Nocardioides sp. B-3]